MAGPHRMDRIPNATFAVLSGVHVPDLAREILPSAPMRFVGEWAPFSRGYRTRMTKYGVSREQTASAHQQLIVSRDAFST